MADDPMVLDGPPAPPEPVADVAPEPVIPADPDEAEAVDLPAGKHVPLTALKAVRDENRVLKERAARVDALEQENARLRPYADFVQQNPQLRQPAVPAVTAPATADPDLLDLAKSLDFYTAEGKPDLDRAARHQALVEKSARKMAQEVVGPLAMSTYERQATQNWNRVVAAKLPNGQPIDTNLLTVAWQSVGRTNPAMLADERVVRIIENNVMAEQMRAGYQAPPVAPSRPPVVTESSGTRPGTRARMNEAERGIVGDRLDDAKFADLTKEFQKGRMNALED